MDSMDLDLRGMQKLQVFCRKLILKGFNGTSKPSLIIALKILKTIKKPLTPMAGPSKNIQWWWSIVVKTIEVDGGLKKKH